MTAPVDTSAARAAQLARRLRSVPLDMTVDEFDAAGDLIEALAAEREALLTKLRESEEAIEALVAGRAIVVARRNTP